MALLFALLPSLLAAPWSLTQIAVSDDAIRHLLLGRWVLCVKPRDALVAVDGRSGWFGCVLRFRDGSKIRVPGISVWAIEQMRRDLLIS